MKTMLKIGFFPAIQRDLFLSRCFRKLSDRPREISTMKISWDDMAVSFASDEAVCSALVEVEEEISLVILSKRLESLLDCGSKVGQGEEWVLKYSTPLHRCGLADDVTAKLCDRISSVDPETEEVIGVMKIKRRSVSKGHAKVRIAPQEDSLQVVCRHTSAQGLKAVWKSVLWRLSPQHGERKKDGIFIVCRPYSVSVQDKDSHKEALELARNLLGQKINKNFNRYWEHYIPTTVEKLTELHEGGLVSRGCYFLYRKHTPEYVSFRDTNLGIFLSRLRKI